MPQNLQQNQINSYGYVPPNLLVNGGFEMWQRGAGPLTKLTSTRGFLADEWETAVGSGTGEQLVMQRDTVNQKIGTSCLKVSYTKGTGSLSVIQQGVECYKSLTGLTVTFSCWVKTNVANAIRLQVGSIEGAAVSAYHTGSGNWERLTAVCILSTSIAANASYAHSFGLEAVIGFTASVTDALLDGATLVVGNFPEGVPFVPMNPAEDMQRCQRFYETGYFHYVGYAGKGTVANEAQLFITEPMQPKAAIPTMARSGLNVQYIGGGGVWVDVTASYDGVNHNVGDSAPTVNTHRPFIQWIDAVHGPGMYGTCAQFGFTWTAEVP